MRVAALLGTAVAVLGAGAAWADGPLGAFASPPASDRASNWSGGSADATAANALTDTLKGAGFGATQVGYTPSDQGRASLSSVLQHAQSTGMRVDLAPCNNTSCDSSAVTLATGMQQLVTRTQTVDAATDNFAFTGSVPAAAMPGSPVLVAVTAAKVSGTDGTQTLLDPTTAVDLTSKVSGDTLTWTVPTQGQWKVFAFYQRATGQFVNPNPFEGPDVWTARDPAVGAASGRLVADIFSSKGLNDTLDLMANTVFGDGNQQRLQDMGTTLFHDSMEIQATAFWTGDLPAQFASRRGYSMIKWLPALDNSAASSFNPLNPANVAPVPAPPFDFTGGVGARFRADYHRTLNDLYVNRYVKAMTDWAHDHGLRSREQVAYNYANLDVIRAATKTDIPESETFDFGWGAHPFQNTLPTYPDNRWRYVVDSHKLMSSGAHLGGHNRVTTEWGEDFATWSKQPLDYADQVNDAVAGGVTLPIFAAGIRIDDGVYPQPGGLSFIGLDASWATNQPQFKDVGDLMTYLARTTHVVEHGSPRVDVTIYRDGGLSSLHDLDVPLFKSAQLARHGYTYDFIDPVDLAQGNDPFDGGPHYRALIVDSQRSLTVDAARAIRRYAAEGLPVVIVGDVPSQAAGLKDPAANDARVQAAMQAALAAPSVVHVATEDDVPSALAGLGVDPGARFTGAGADIWTVRRHTGHDETWWLYNPTDSPISTTGSLAASGHPYLLDLWNGTSMAVAQYVSSGGRTDLPVTIPAHGTAALVIAHGSGGQHLVATSAQHASYDAHGKLVLEDAGGGTQSYTLSNGHSGTVNLGPAVAPITLTNWHLDVDEVTPAGHTAHHLDLSALADWRDIPELADAVGSATYSATFTAPGSWSGRGVRLALGAFAGAARISVNGVRVTRQTTPGGDIVITSQVHPGANSLVVNLDTTVNNRNAQLAASGNGLFSTGPTPLAPTPSGLLGPVTVTPTEMASVRG